MTLQRAAHPARPARRPIARHRCRWRRAASRPCEDRASRARHPAVAEGSRESGRRAFDLGAETLGGSLEVVRPEAFGKSRPDFPKRSRLAIDARDCLGKARDSSSRDALGDLRPGEDLARGQPGGRLDDGKPRRRDVGGDQPLADAGGDGVGSGEEEGNVGAEGQADRKQPLQRPVEAPEAIEGEQRRRGVRAAAAEPGAPRDAACRP